MCMYSYFWYKFLALIPLQSILTVSGLKIRLFYCIADDLCNIQDDSVDNVLTLILNEL